MPVTISCYDVLYFQVDVFLMFQWSGLIISIFFVVAVEYLGNALFQMLLNGITVISVD